MGPWRNVEFRVSREACSISVVVVQGEACLVTTLTPEFKELELQMPAYLGEPLLMTAILVTHLRNYKSFRLGLTAFAVHGSHFASRHEGWQYEG